MLRDAALTEHFATTFASMLLRLSGHTEADETFETVRGILQPVQIIATYAIGRHAYPSLLFSSRKKGWVCLSYTWLPCNPYEFYEYSCTPVIANYECTYIQRYLNVYVYTVISLSIVL